MDVELLVKELKTLSSTQLQNYFFPRKDDLNRCSEFTELLDYINRTDDGEVLRRLVDLNPHLLFDLPYIASIRNLKLLKLCMNIERFELDSVDHMGFTTLYRCCSLPERMFKDAPNMGLMLLKAGANPNHLCDAKYIAPKRIEKGYTPLMKATLCDSSELIKVLVNGGADISLVNKKGQTAIDLAIDMKRGKALATLESF